MSELPKLKPCPFCGGHPEMIHIGNEYTKIRKLTIKCPKCRITLTNAARIHSFQWLENISAEQWNSRHSPEQVGEVESGDSVCEEDDGCPTEGARLKREWRQLQSRCADQNHKLQNLWSLSKGQGGLCRDCADHGPTCPNNDHLPCDPTERTLAYVWRLEAQNAQQQERIGELENKIEWQDATDYARQRTEQVLWRVLGKHGLKDAAAKALLEDWDE